MRDACAVAGEPRRLRAAASPLVEDGGMEPPKEVPRPSNVLENRNEHLHSLFPAPFPQKSAHGNPDTTHLRGPEYPWARHGHDHGRTALPKDKNKEGAGHRLLNVSRGLAGDRGRGVYVLPPSGGETKQSVCPAAR